MEASTVGAAINAAVIVGYTLAAVWRGYHRRRPHWTRRSWISLGLVVSVGFTLAAFALVLSTSVDSHQTWVGAPRSSTRARWTLVALGAMIGGVLLAGGSLAWFAVGEPTRQVMLFGAHRGRAGSRSPVGGSSVDASTPNGES